MGSYREFIQKTRISLREANESKYWLTIMDELDAGDPTQRKKLLEEAREIALILGAIDSKAQKKVSS